MAAKKNGHALSTRYMAGSHEDGTPYPEAYDAIEAVRKGLPEVDFSFGEVDEYGWFDIVVKTANDAKLANIYLAGWSAGRAKGYV